MRRASGTNAAGTRQQRSSDAAPARRRRGDHAASARQVRGGEAASTRRRGRSYAAPNGEGVFADGASPERKQAKSYLGRGFGGVAPVNVAPSGMRLI
jgi:hypothetical protein